MHAYDLPTPRRQYARAVRSILVLGHFPSPTADIYLRERLTAAAVPVHYADIRSAPTTDAALLLPDGCFVIVVRYLDKGIARLLEQRASHLAGVAYLMDDDLPGALTSPGLALPYRMWLTLKWRKTAPLIARLASEIWLSSDGLMARYGHLPNVHRINPLYLRSSEPAVRIFYHAISSHEGDALWLRDIIADVQKARTDTFFEIIGQSPVLRAYRHLPRCDGRLPVPWPEYLARTAAHPFDIGLAPLEASTFNACRSYTKFFDITRAGAVGIFTDQGPYKAIIEDGVNGLLRPQDPEAWRQAIMELSDDAARRAGMHRAALATAQALHEGELKNPLFDRFL